MATQQRGGFGFGTSTPLPRVEFYTAMINPSLRNLDSFDNSDPRILTVLLIGTEDRIRTYIHRQHRLGITEAGAWSKPLPVPNCPGKFMSILNKTGF